MTQETAGLAAVMVALMTPTSSSGSVRIDGAEKPLVDFKLLDDERDLQALAAGVQFAVRGVDNLFVCDASVFPTIPDVNTHLPTTMLAERFCLGRARRSRQ